jgi:hypothetical protein
VRRRNTYGYPDAYTDNDGYTDGNADRNTGPDVSSLLEHDVHRGRVADVHDQPGPDGCDDGHLDRDVRNIERNGGRRSGMYSGC